MRTPLSYAVLGLALAVSSTACAGGSGRAEPATSPASATVAAATAAPTPTPTSTPTAEPTTPGEFLDSARKAMAGQPGWTFAVDGKEDLTAQGRTSSASYRATVQFTERPAALHASGVSVSNGKDRSEEIFVTGTTVHLKEAGRPWQHGPVSDPGMQAKVEDPRADLEAFGAYLRDPEGGVTLTRSQGRVELRVRVSSTKVPQLRDRTLRQKVTAELDSTVTQLEKAGVPVDPRRLTVAGLQETLALDPVTHRIVSHRFRLRVLIPYGQQVITYAQDVREDARGVFGGDIRLPADAR
jgi:hypothetical protein